MLEPLSVDPFEGQVFAGRYLVETVIGEGAMGRVYRARHTRMSKRFAIKIMFGDLAADPTMRARFAAEAEAASRLEHPNVVSVVDFGETVGGLVYMVMELVEGLRLSSIIDRGPMAEGRVRAMVRQIALGLQHAHDKGLVHRDLKADNVVVVSNEGLEQPKIIDFGIAMLADAASGPGRLTAVGVVIGTPAYMSPEQACGEKIDHRSDLFSLGLLAYEMLAGRKPFDGHPFEVARQNVAATPPPISDRTPGVQVHPAFEELVFQLLAKRREDRPPTAQALVEALDAIATPEGALERAFVGPAFREPAPRGGTSEVDLSVERPPLARRSRVIGGSVAAAALALAAVLVVNGVDGGENDAPPPVEQETAREAAPPATEDPPVARAEVPVEQPPLGAEDDPDEPVPEDPPAASRAKKRRPPRARIVEEPQREERPVETPVTISVGAVSQRYKDVGAALDELSKKKAAAVSPLRERYFALPFSEALMNPAVRGKVMAELERLDADLRKLRR